MVVSREEAAVEILKRRQARAKLHDFICYMNPDYIVSDFSLMVCAQLDSFIVEMINGERPVLILGAPPQHGKELAIDTPVFTPSGWKSHGELKAGDYVFHPSGKQIKVLANIPQPEPCTLRVTLSNGEWFDAHPRHEWTVTSHDWSGYKTFETQELMDQGLCKGEPGKRGSRYRFQLPIAQCVETERKSLPIDAYFLGAWLGDGAKCAPIIYEGTNDLEVCSYIDTVYKRTSTRYHSVTGVRKVAYVGQGIARSLRDIGVHNNKHIPIAYLTASKEDRLRLLAGLIDTDGSLHQKTGQYRFINTNKRLVDDVKTLLSTLGYSYSETVVATKRKNRVIRDVQDCYQIGFTPADVLPCQMKRKQSAHQKLQRKVSIVSIEPASPVPGNCITIDSPDGLYLAGKTMQATHNSDIVSRYFPAFVFGNYPDLRIGGLSYAKDLASDMNRDVQRIMMSDEYRLLFPESSLNSKRVVTIDVEAKRNSETFEIVGRKGVYVGQGVGGPLTGKKLDCFVAGTKVTTSHGSIDIDKLHMQPSSCKILSYDTKKKAFKYENLQAVASRKGYGIYRVTTASGRVFEATGDHRVYTEKGWVEARKLTASDVLLCGVRKESDTDRSGLQKNNKNEQKLWKLLLQKMRVYGDTERQAEKVRHLPKAISCGWAKILFEKVYACALQASPKKSNLRDVPKRVHGISYVGWISAILRQRMLGQGTRKAHDGGWQSSVQGWSKPAETAAAFGQGVPAYTAENITEGWRSVRPMPDRSEKIRGASHGWMGKQQRITEPCKPVREASLGSSQENGFRAVRDHAVKVERVLDEATTYDIQVSGNHNFFANGILVHNCGIIDDPIKNAKEALSATVKASVWNWYTSTFLTRLSKNSGQIIMATRWATDDLSGRVLQVNTKAKNLAFPAINEVGEALVPDLHPIDKLLETKATLGDYFWSAMYQQSPKTIGGAIFKEHGVRHYLPNDLPDKFDKVIQSWDLTFKDTDGTDYVVGQVWGKKGANSYLMHEVRDRLSFTESLAAIRRVTEMFPRSRVKLIEDKANGPAVIDTLKSTVSGLSPVEPDGSKVARAHAMTGEWEAGNIWVPHPDVAPWVKDWEAEITTFPAGANDDRVDAMTQAIRYLYQAKQSTLTSKRLFKLCGHLTKNSSQQHPHPRKKRSH